MRKDTFRLFKADEDVIVERVEDPEAVDKTLHLQVWGLIAQQSCRISPGTKD